MLLRRALLLPPVFMLLPLSTKPLGTSPGLLQAVGSGMGVMGAALLRGLGHLACVETAGKVRDWVSSGSKVWLAPMCMVVWRGWPLLEGVTLLCWGPASMLQAFGLFRELDPELALLSTTDVACMAGAKISLARSRLLRLTLPLLSNHPVALLPDSHSVLGTPVGVVREERSRDVRDLLLLGLR